MRRASFITSVLIACALVAVVQEGVGAPATRPGAERPDRPDDKTPADRGTAAGSAKDTPSTERAASQPAATERAASKAATSPDVEPAPAASTRLLAEIPDGLSSTIDSWFAGNGTRRLHVQLDRPLYRPGEDIWVKTWNVATRTLDPQGTAGGITYELLDPRGQVVETKRVQQTNGTATNDFVLPADAPGGRWTLKATTDTGEVDERPLVVASYEAPRIKKELDFVREAYGPGDRVEALVELTRPTGGPLADHPVRALLQVDGNTVLERELRTDATGAVFVAAALPADLSSGDGLLTVLVEDGGVTESISRSVPIVLADLKLAFYPEGGDLVTALPGRVYFEANDRHGEPADVSGRIEDDQGRKVAEFESVHDGLGRFAFTPEPGRSYHARITAPEGLEDLRFELPVAQEAGCTVRSYDDVHSEQDAVRVGVRCTTKRDVVVTGVLGEQTIDAAAVRAGPTADAVVYLKPSAELADRQGAVRVTVFDADRSPLAERLVYRNHGKNLGISITPDRASYGPRDEVTLTVQTTGADGKPLPAELALSVVDDAVLGLADDENGHMLSRLYLEPELVDAPDDPAWYFDDEEALAARGVDLVMGTRGWRRFDWQPVFAPPVASVAVVETRGGGRRYRPEPMAAPMAGPPMIPMAQAEPAMVVDAPMPMEPMVEEAEAIVAEKPMAELAAMPAHGGKVMAAEKKRDMHRAADRDDRQMLGGLGYLGDVMMMDELGYFGGEVQLAWAPVRVFPRPEPTGEFDGVRTDFRDTVHWEPTLVTDAEGKGTVTFRLSDAVTTFRVVAEGLGGGRAGHEEATLTSVLPVSVAAKLPAAVSAGDRLLLPVTVTNGRNRAAQVVAAASSTSGALTVGEGCGNLKVAAGASDTCWIPVDVGSAREIASLRIEARGDGVTDAIDRPLQVVPAGFPRGWAAAGENRGVTEHAFTLEPHVADSLRATVTWHPSTVATLISGMEGLIREPGGCFEQTSSTNWPNVAILSYLEAHDGDPRVRAESSRALQVGYDKLTGYQIQAGGFETWGSGPGKEALSAFGLLQFSDMKQVFPVAMSILDRDVAYLLGQRDGSGGFRNTGESAHGYGSAPQPVLDGFITWSLVSTGHGDKLKKELARQAEVSRTTKDPYVLALATRSLLATKDPAARAAVDRLAALQARDGSFPGAESSITRSYEANLDVESTALAALALMEAGDRFAAADKAAAWLIEHRQGPGTWGATQATALALSALTKHADLARRPRTAGHLAVEVNGKPIGDLRYEADQATPLVIAGLEAALVPGANKIVLKHDGGEPLPYTIDVAWASETPASAPGAELSLTTSLDRSEVEMGETVRLTARVENRTGDVVPSPIARIGLPAGLEPQLWQLQELQDRGVVAFFETRPREVTLYWDGIHTKERHEVKLDLLAAVPGTFEGPASSGYPYYDDDEKSWARGLEVTVTPPR